jgi:hypothetical protein
VTAGDEARPGTGWVPPEPSPDTSRAPASTEPAPTEPARADHASTEPGGTGPAADPHTEVVEQETQPLTRASIRAAQAARLAEEAQERRQASLAVSALPRGVRVLAVGSTVAFAALLGLSALSSADALAVAVGFVSVVLAWGWVRLTDAPSQRGAALVLAAGALVICAAAALTRTDPYLIWVPVAVAVSVVAAFLHQVFRPAGRPRLTEGIAASAGALAVMASGATFIPIPHYPHGGQWVLVSVVAVAAAALPDLLLGHHVSAGWVLLAAVVLGTVAAVLTGVLGMGVPAGPAALVGVLVAGISHSMMRVLFALPSARAAQSAVAVGGAAVLSVGVVVYLLARIFAG